MSFSLPWPTTWYYWFERRWTLISNYVSNSSRRFPFSFLLNKVLRNCVKLIELMSDQSNGLKLDWKLSIGWVDVELTNNLFFVSIIIDLNESNWCLIYWSTSRPFEYCLINLSLHVSQTKRPGWKLMAVEISWIYIIKDEVEMRKKTTTANIYIDICKKMVWTYNFKS